MRALFAIALSALTFTNAQAAKPPVLDCNFNFDYIAQIQVFEEPSGALSFRVLTNRGSWLDKQPLPAAQWAAKDIRFEARGRYLDGGFDVAVWNRSKAASILRTGAATGTTKCAAPSRAPRARSAARTVISPRLFLVSQLRNFA